MAASLHFQEWHNHLLFVKFIPITWRKTYGEHVLKIKFKDSDVEIMFLGASANSCFLLVE
jgi:hypothetical protein